MGCLFVMFDYRWYSCLFGMFYYRWLQFSACVVLLQLVTVVMFSYSCAFSSICFQTAPFHPWAARASFRAASTLETTSVLALFPITPILQTLPALGPRPPEISTRLFFMACPHTAMKSMPSGILIVFTVGSLALDPGQTSRGQVQRDQPAVCPLQVCVASSSSQDPPRPPWQDPRAARTWCSPGLCDGRSYPSPPNSSSTGSQQFSRPSS